jgi:hypothetical protein
VKDKDDLDAILDEESAGAFPKAEVIEHPRSTRKLAKSAGKHAAKGAKSALDGIAELFGTAPICEPGDTAAVDNSIFDRARRCFRYPIDGPNEIEKAIDDAIEEIFGPTPADSACSEWLRKLRRNGLIP